MDEITQIAQPPSFLKKDAKNKYYEIAQMLRAEGKWKTGDEIALSALCACYQRWMQSEKEIKKNKTLTFETDTGYKQQIPEISIANNSMKAMLGFIKEFALTPKERAKLKELLAENNEDDEMEDMIVK